MSRSIQGGVDGLRVVGVVSSFATRLLKLAIQRSERSAKLVRCMGDETLL